MLEVFAEDLLELVHVQKDLSHEAVVGSCPVPKSELQLSLLQLALRHDVREQLIAEARLISLKTRLPK